MNDSNSSSLNPKPDRSAWNKGKLTGPKPPLRPGHVWLIRAKLQLKGAHATWHCSISPSTASCGAAISSRCASMTWRPTGTPSTAPTFASEKALERRNETVELPRSARQLLSSRLDNNSGKSGHCQAHHAGCRAQQGQEKFTHWRVPPSRILQVHLMHMPVVRS